MRVIAGQFKSRILQNPKNKNTHPMSEKIRGAMFNALGDVSDLVVLDAFAGSGAVGIEALSRGAARVCAVEINPDSFAILQQNRDLVTDSEHMSVHRANIKSWLGNQSHLEFDLVIADPPYDAIGMNAIEACAERVKVGGLFVLSIPPAEHITFRSLRKIDEKTYGDAKLVFYRKEK